MFLRGFVLNFFMLCYVMNVSRDFFAFKDSEEEKVVPALFRSIFEENSEKQIFTKF